MEGEPRPSERMRRIEDIYHAALERDITDRPAFLAEACGGDEALLREVTSLLAADRRAGDFLEGSPGRVAAEMLDAEWPQPISSRQPAMTDIGSGQVISHYRIIEKLGKGGMGVVYKAKDLSLERTVALKFLAPHIDQDPESKMRFIREARASAALDHPNVCTMYEIAEANGRIFMAMALIDGERVTDRIARRPLKLSEALDIAIQTAQGLQAAHEQGIVHRDIKSANLMVNQRGELKIMDFGTAQVADHTRLTQSMMVVGTPAYLSPEQAQGMVTDRRSDIWSLGIVLYEMPTGRLPFKGDNPQAMLRSIIHEDYEPVTALRVGIPVELDRIIAKALAKNPDERYQHADELLVDLRNLARQSVSTSMSPLKDVPRLASMKRRPILLTVGLLLIAVVMLALAVYPRFNQPLDSIAVLPFVNDSDDPETDYLVDGITESLINSLSQASRLSVIARTTALSYKGKTGDPQRIGRDLNVRAIVTGRLTQRGENLAIQADLIDVTTGRQLWGEHYNRKLSDILAIQDDIAARILEGVRLRLSVDEQQRLVKHHTENPEAYQLYLLGRYYGAKMTPDSFSKAVERFDRAIELDPKYALAYAGKSEAYSLAQDTLLPADEVVPKAREFATKAIQLDETLSEGHCAMALVHSFYDFDWPATDREFNRALALDPASACVGDNYGSILSIIGRAEESLQETKRALQVDPRSILRYFNRGQALYYSGQYDQAIETLGQAKDLDPTHGLVRILLGFAYTQQSKFDEALAEFRSLPPEAGEWLTIYVLSVSGRRNEALERMEKVENFQTPLIGAQAWTMAIIYTGLGDNDQAFEWLEKARDAHFVVIPSLKVDPVFRSLRPDPRFAQLIRSVGLEP